MNRPPNRQFLRRSRPSESAPQKFCAADRLPVAVGGVGLSGLTRGLGCPAGPEAGADNRNTSKADRPHAASSSHILSMPSPRQGSAPDCPHHAAISARRLAFSARHTRCHSPRTLSKPRRLNRRRCPSTSLTQPFGPSDIHLRLAY